MNGFDMHYRVVGSGEPLLLLHGFAGCGDNFDPFVPTLAQQYQLIIPDLRGHGRSTNPAKTFTFRQSATDVLALLDHLGLPRVRAMGISAGGMTLLHMATRQPSRIEAMVLVGASPTFPPEARAAMSAGLGQVPPEIRALQEQCAVRGREQLDELSTQFTSFKDSYDDMTFTAPSLGTITARTLIVHGDRDVFFPVTIPVDLYRGIRNAELWIVPGGDHVPVAGPRQGPFLATVADFFRRR
jgi:pimeloyl-ACP methyl ester carboxylesterase